MNQELLAKTAHFVEATAAEISDNHQKLAAVEATRQKYAAHVEQTVDNLIRLGFVKQASRAVAIQTFSDPTQALDHMIKLASGVSQTSDEDTSRLGTMVEPGQNTAAPTTTTKRAAATRRFGAHGDKFVQSLGLDPNSLG